MEDIVEEYAEIIKDFESKIVRKFSLKKLPWESSGLLFEKAGSIDEYNYSFHGSGCTLEKNGIICEYDVAPLNGKNIKFSLWKISEFIRTNPEYSKLQYEMSFIENELSKLIEEKKLSWLEIEGKLLNIYQKD